MLTVILLSIALAVLGHVEGPVLGGIILLIVAMGWWTAGVHFDRSFLLSAALLLALVVAYGGAKPDAAVTGFFDAMKAGDGARAVSYMSQASIDEMGAGLEELKADTTGMAAAMLPMMGINVTPEQLQSMSTEDFVAALFSSQMIKDMFANASVTILSSEVNGDNAVVKVSTNMNGEISEENIELVREGGVWKLDMGSMGI